MAISEARYSQGQQIVRNIEEVCIKFVYEIFPVLCPNLVVGLGREFHASKPAIRKALWPHISMFFLGTDSNTWSTDLRCRRYVLSVVSLHNTDR